MSWKRAIGRALAEASALTRNNRPRPGVRILMYHAVGSRLADDPYGISISLQGFRQQMEILALEQPTQVVSFDALQSASYFGQLHGQEKRLRVAVTFDDGYKDNLFAVAPIMIKLQIPFTVFVTSSFIQNGSSDYLSASELSELAALPGVTIGSHGATHRPLAKCDDATLRWELDESRHYLQEMIGKSVTALSYPHGSVDERVRDAARQAGYVLAGTSCFDINGASHDPLMLCRCEIVAQDSERVFRQKLNGNWDWKRWRASFPA
ncbi:MAG: polysaccharide deacetylase family protein [Blastocatellia bacterium]|nr:polysaccharide deacetylase family protein [Blastocatellia bacterium]